MSWVVIPKGNGAITHENVDPTSMTLPDDAEVYDDRESFNKRIEDF